MASKLLYFKKCKKKKINTQWNKKKYIKIKMALWNNDFLRSAGMVSWRTGKRMRKGRRGENCENDGRRGGDDDDEEDEGDRMGVKIWIKCRECVRLELEMVEGRPWRLEWIWSKRNRWRRDGVGFKQEEEKKWVLE